MARFKQFIANYWRGQVGFATVAMLNVIFLAICLFFPFGATSEIWAFTSITLIGTCAVVVAIWMAIGAFRTGDRLTRENGGMMAVWALFALTLFAPFGASILTFKAALRHAAMVQPIVPLVAAILPLDISPDRREIHLSGDLDFTLRARFLHTLTVHPLIDSVILTSNGGNVFAARSLAINIQEAELSIRVDQHCYSSCTLVFMASSQRSLGPEGQLGFHGYRYDMENRVQTLNIQEEEDKDRTYFSAKGVSSEFIDRIFDTPPTDIWRPDRKTLLAAGIITE